MEKTPEKQHQANKKLKDRAMGKSMTTNKVDKQQFADMGPKTKGEKRVGVKMKKGSC